MKSSDNKKIYIIGGGAAGMFAAITVKRNGGEPVIIEGNDRVGKKILATGNGKCNLSHNNIDATSYYGSGVTSINNYLSIFGTKETIDFFASMGMLIREKEEYLYPYSEQASTVLDVIRYELERLNVQIITDCKVTKIGPNKDGGYLIHTKDKNTFFANRIIIATGGLASPKSGSDGSGLFMLEKIGVSINQTVPALVKLKSNSSLCKMLDGVRAKGNLDLYINGSKATFESGEIQFTKDGLSGIPIFNISRVACLGLVEKKKVKVVLDLIPDLSKEEVVGLLLQRLSGYKNGELAPDKLFTGIVNKKITLAVLKKLGIKAEEVQKIDKDRIQKFCDKLKSFEFDIIDFYGYDNAQVTAGGVNFSEVSDSLCLKKYPGIFLAGEILDIDGKCGGYNLQWAWTSGYIAGLNAVK